MASFAKSKPYSIFKISSFLRQSWSNRFKQTTMDLFFERSTGIKNSKQSIIQIKKNLFIDTHTSRARLLESDSEIETFFDLLFIFLVNFSFLFVFLHEHWFCHNGSSHSFGGLQTSFNFIKLLSLFFFKFFLFQFIRLRS